MERFCLLHNQYYQSSVVQNYWCLSIWDKGDRQRMPWIWSHAMSTQWGSSFHSSTVQAVLAESDPRIHPIPLVTSMREIVVDILRCIGGTHERSGPSVDHNRLAIRIKFATDPHCPMNCNTWEQVELSEGCLCGDCNILKTVPWSKQTYLYSTCLGSVLVALQLLPTAYTGTCTTGNQLAILAWLIICRMVRQKLCQWHKINILRSRPRPLICNWHTHYQYGWCNTAISIWYK